MNMDHGGQENDPIIIDVDEPSEMTTNTMEESRLRVGMSESTTAMTAAHSTPVQSSSNGTKTASSPVKDKAKPITVDITGLLSAGSNIKQEVIAATSGSSSRGVESSLKRRRDSNEDTATNEEDKKAGSVMEDDDSAGYPKRKRKSAIIAATAVAATMATSKDGDFFSASSVARERQCERERERERGLELAGNAENSESPPPVKRTRTEGEAADSSADTATRDVTSNAVVSEGSTKEAGGITTTEVASSRSNEHPPNKAERKDSMGSSSQTSSRKSKESEDKSANNTNTTDEIISNYVDLPPLASPNATLPALSQRELSELEAALGIVNKQQATSKTADFDDEEEDNAWPEDWSGNLSLVDKDISNPGHATSSSSSSSRRSSSNNNGAAKKSVLLWARGGNRQSLKILHYLIRYVYHLDGTPRKAKEIFADANPNSVKEMEFAVRRVLYDPFVLRQDGWTTAKSKQRVGATGGPFRIGDEIRWQNFDAVVIAYIHDHDMGDLWRAIWIDDTIETFDLEAEELEHARRSWEKMQRSSQRRPSAKLQQLGSGGTSGSNSSPSSQPSSSQTASEYTPSAAGAASSSSRRSRFSADSNFTVSGIEHGIVLAASYSRQARQGVYWPARIMHTSETTKPAAKSKRSAPRQRLDVVFLAPYWNSSDLPATSSSKTRGRAESFTADLSKQGQSMFRAGPLFDFENIDASDDMIKEYPYGGHGGIDIEQLKVAFRFTGLPKAVFPRFLDSHRIALALKTYARHHITSRFSGSSADFASAGLFDTHAMSIQVPIFPQEVLHLPFQFILSQLPSPNLEQKGGNMSFDDAKSKVEPVLQLNTIIDAMKPPHSWGQGTNGSNNVGPSNTTQQKDGEGSQIAESPSVVTGIALLENGKDGCPSLKLDYFINGLEHIKKFYVKQNESSFSSLGCAFGGLEQVLAALAGKRISSDPNDKKWRNLAKSLLDLWAVTKSRGEETIEATMSLEGGNINTELVVSEWRRVCERIYRYVTHVFSHQGFGNGVSTVLTDSRCNEHITSSGCFERPVRLPAAIKAAKDIGAGSKDEIKLITSIESQYLQLATSKVLGKAHSSAYVKRMKSRCNAIKNADVVALTEDSAGNGGEDTKGSRGTWKAALVGVATAIKAIDMVVRGECVNAFCVTRPPGHHAGRELHAMKAVSNGFCILNAVACAALYATSLTSEGGPGLKRVCVIDFDVHHGNGTQDVLCSTYDPRFLYVSMHAGGAHVNGESPSNDDGTDGEAQSPGGQSSQLKGIFPGRCGDTSPHKGVLNIPLGHKVTSHAVGTALISQVTPAVDSFAPDMIILSAGFDAHKNDPLGLGGLSAEDFGHITDAVGQLAFKCCSGRLISVLEGGYGVPCCRPQVSFIPPPQPSTPNSSEAAMEEKKLDNGSTAHQQQVDVRSEDMSSPQPALEISKQEQEQLRRQRPQPSKLVDLGDNLPKEMDDQVPYPLQRRLEKCHAEGFMECIKAHVQSLAKCNKHS